jgi:uncharacterized protein (DUF924 family)
MRMPEDVIRFWFVEHGIEDWFGGKPEFDQLLAEQFAQTHAAVARGEAWRWRRTPEGRLAEIIVLDQFSRQLHRGSGKAFAQDTMALALAQEAVAAGADQALSTDRRMFLFMPFLHAESLVIQEEAVKLFRHLDHEMMQYATGHRDVISRFGRFPFRNVALGRQSTPEEVAYMAEDKGGAF